MLKALRDSWMIIERQLLSRQKRLHRDLVSILRDSRRCWSRVLTFRLANANERNFSVLVQELFRFKMLCPLFRCYINAVKTVYEKQQRKMLIIAHTSRTFSFFLDSKLEASQPNFVSFAESTKSSTNSTRSTRLRYSQVLCQHAVLLAIS